MVVAHIIGKGAPELVRFWGEPPLVREPDVMLFGLERIDAPEQEFLNKSPMRRVSAADVQAKGAARSGAGYFDADARGCAASGAASGYRCDRAGRISRRECSRQRGIEF